MRLPKLAAFCEGKPEFASVLEMAKRAQFRMSVGRKIPTTTVRGFVYLTRQGEDYRIARFRAAQRREQLEAYQLEQRPELFHIIRTPAPAGIERYWRGRFRSKRHGRTLFRLADEDLGAFKRRRFQ